MGTMTDNRTARGTNGGQQTVLQTINLCRDALTAGEDRAAAYLIHHYPAAGLGPMARFARAANVSPQTVMRLMAKLRIANWEEFQDRLRTELAREQTSPLGRWTAYRPAPSGRAEWLHDFGGRLARNVAGTFAGLVPRDFEASARLIVDPKRRVVVIGGRFTQQLARLLARHLQIVRGGVEEIGSLTATWPDRLIDVDRKTTAIVFDVRRYSPEVIRFAAAAAKQGAAVIAITDSTKAPVAKFADHCMVGKFESAGAWDSITAHLAVTEALVARVTELAGARTANRLARIESMRDWIKGED
jgi:DNA-binding MurR/RpiR family transcriptional regulator